MTSRRKMLAKSAAALAGLAGMQSPMARLSPSGGDFQDIQGGPPILVAVELSGGNDGLNSVVPFTNDAYYRQRPMIGIKRESLLPLDDDWGLNPGMLGLQRLWQAGELALVHGCGYAQPSYSHFTSMAYWHTGAPHSGDAYGWMGRLADALAGERRENMLINVGASQSLAVKSKVHTPVVFDDPERFQRHRWMTKQTESKQVASAPQSNRNRQFLNAVDLSAQQSSATIREAWRTYRPAADYGIAPMDLPKVAACIKSGLSTQLYHVSFRNNSFDTHVQQPALHRRLLSYACDGIHGFIQDLKAIGAAQRVVVMVFSEFGRRVPENANLGTDHGSANMMFLAGAPVRGGHFGTPPSLTELVDGDNLAYTTDFRQVYASAIEGWLGVPARSVLHDDFARFDLFTT